MHYVFGDANVTRRAPREQPISTALHAHYWARYWISERPEFG